MADTVIPSRTRLSTWHAEGLHNSSPTVKAAGERIESAASQARTFCMSLPVDNDWTGLAHDAAQTAFDRGFKATAHISDAATAVAGALVTAFHAVSRAKTSLLDAVQHVEAPGEFTVDDHWVVQLAARAWTDDEIDDVRALQSAAQTSINERVESLALADDPQTLLAAVRSAGFDLASHDGILVDLLGGKQPPVDEAPNPSGGGLQSALSQQDLIRRQWEASTPRKVSEDHVAEHDGYQGYTTKTLEMQDGSRQEIKTVDPLEHPFTEDVNSSRREEVSVTTFDPGGQLVSTVSSWKTSGGTKFTETRFASGTSIVFAQSPDGVRRATITVDDFTRDIPSDDPLWAHPVQDSVGAALTGIEKGFKEANNIPYISSATASKIEIGARYAGPAVGIATALVDVYAAPTLQDKCVAGVSSLASLGAGTGGAELGAVAGSAAGPIGTGVGAAASGFAFGWIGSKLGTQVGGLLCK